MKIILPLAVLALLLAGCSSEPEPPQKYHFSSKQEYLKYYLPVQDDHGGVKKWDPSPDADCRGGKIYTHGDGYQSTFCPKDGNEDLFKL